jgi:hypothetical protein
MPSSDWSSSSWVSTWLCGAALQDMQSFTGVDGHPQRFLQLSNQLDLFKAVMKSIPSTTRLTQDICLCSSLLQGKPVLELRRALDAVSTDQLLEAATDQGFVPEEVAGNATTISPDVVAELVIALQAVWRRRQWEITPLLTVISRNK